MLNETFSVIFKHRALGKSHAEFCRQMALLEVLKRELKIDKAIINPFHDENSFAKFCS